LERQAPELAGIKQAGPWDPFRKYEGREIEFAKEVLGYVHPVTGKVTLWEAQRYIIEKLFEHRFVNVRSCRSSGKTHTAGRVVIPTFLYTAPSRVLVIAPTLAQVRDVIWPHIASAKSEALRQLPGKLGVRTLRIDQDHFAIGIPSRNPDNIRGHHAGVVVPGDPDADEATDDELAALTETDSATRLLVVVDEPEGIGEETFRVLRGMYSKPNVYVLMQGNPTLGIDDDHEYVRASQVDSRYHNIRISAVSDEEVVSRGGTVDPLPADKVFDRVPRYLISEDWIETQFNDYELDDPFFLSDVLGRFAAGSTRSLVVPRMVLEKALEHPRHLHRTGPRIGVDIGGTGDSCVAVLMYHGEVCSMHEWRPDSDDTQAMVSVAETIMDLAQHWGYELGERYDDYPGFPIDGSRISIDDTGLNGVADIMASKGVSVDRVNFGSRARGDYVDIVGPQRFKNTRTEMYWVARRGLQEGLFRVPEKYKRIWQQLQWTRYERELTPRGDQLKLESKENVKSRHGRSPDNADAFVLACRENTGPMFSSIKSFAEVSRARSGRRRTRPGWKRLQ
jgi:hypothetical protein